MADKLTKKQEIFCKEYVKDFNASRAAKAAGYSKNTCYTIGAENTKKPHIKARIAELMGDRNERLQIDSDYVLRRLEQIDNLDVGEILDDSGALLPIKQWPKEWRTSVAGVEVATLKGESVISKIKWPDKLKALEMLGKHTKVSAWTSDLDEDDEAPTSLEIKFSVAEPKGDIKITRGDESD